MEVENMILMPRLTPPTTLWANQTEKEEFGIRIMDLEKFFHDAIPSIVKNNPELLSKARFSDYPEIRYVYKPKFNYATQPIPKES